MMEKRKRNLDIECESQQGVRILEEIVEQNRHAMAHYKGGETGKAFSIFQGLLHQWSNRMGSKKIKHAVGITIDPKSKLDNDDSKSPSVLKSYDEGLEYYCNPKEIVGNNRHPELVSATLLLNTGCAANQQMGASSAAPFFQSALDILLPLIAGIQSPMAPTPHKSDLVQILIPILHCMARIEFQRKDTAAGKACYELAIQQSRLLDGPNSLLTGASLNCLGVLLLNSDKKENIQKSSKVFEESIKVYIIAVGPDCPQVATVLNNLGRVLIKLGDVTSSLVCFNKARVLRRKHLGTDHIDYGASLFNLAQNLHHLGRRAEALPLYQEFLRISETSFDTNAREVFIGLSNIADIYHKTGETTKARESYERSLQIARGVLKQTPLEVADLLHRIGTFHFQCGMFRDAQKLYYEGLRIEQNHLEPDHPCITRTLSNIAESYRRMKKLTKSIDFYKRALVLLKVRHGQHSPQVAAALNVVGLVQEEYGDTVGAISTLRSALNVRKAVLGESHVDVSATLLYLGTNLCKVGKTVDALCLFEEAYQIIQELGAKEMISESCACVVFNIGVCHQVHGNHINAMRHFQEALDIRKKLPGNQQSDIAVTMLKLGQILHGEGLFEEALVYYESLLQLYRKTGAKAKKEYVRISRCLEGMVEIYVVMKRTDKIMEAFAEIVMFFREHEISLDLLDISSALELYGFPCARCAASA